jgi:N-acetylglucosamine kinase-like BadF-type ATPase
MGKIEKQEQTDTVDEFKPEDLEFSNLVARELSDPQSMLRFVRNVMRNAEEGDSNSLKIIRETLEELKFKREQKRIVTDEQLKTIITLAADRIRKEG